MKRSSRPAKLHAIAGNAAHQVFIVVAVGATLGLAAVAADGYIGASKQETSTRTANGKAGIAVTAAASAATGQSEHDIYTGSILYMAYDGKRCRQLLFDNKTGLFTDNGYVSCEEAAYNGLNSPKQWSAARMRVIANGFRGE